jgi:NAD(P)-dependent dehydrogenase (short-subunit alcohol dehydrogenase family)
MKPTALITGSEGGIGQSLCRVFADDGYDVVGLDIISGGPASAHFVQADLHELCISKEYLSDVVEEIRHRLESRPLFVLINNAAVQILKPIEGITPEDWQQTLNVNLVAPFLLAQALLTDLEKAQGAIINIASIHAQVTKPGFICYATSKTAMVGLTRSMAVELGPRVRVNAICPAAVRTPMLMAGFEGRERQFEELSQMHPVGRIGQPEEIARLALFLASRAAGFITGASICIDGGIGARLHDPI